MASTGPKLYAPTQTERRLFSRLLRQRALRADVYRRYRQQADEWLSRSELVPQSIDMHGRQVDVTRAELRRSKLFGRHYLVAYVEGDWPSGSDARAMLPNDRTRPPLVLLPTQHMQHRRNELISILEHEFVHINQFLTNAFPCSRSPRTVRSILRNFFQTTAAEYEANLLQLTRWPHLYQPSRGLSLDRWCTLRGYTQALEAMVDEIRRGAIPSIQAVPCLEALPVAIVKGFERIGLVSHADWFQKRWNHHLGIAISHVMQAQSPPGSVEGLEVVIRWWDQALPSTNTSAE
jgi:hypothetical protein